MADLTSNFAQNRQIWTPGSIEPGEKGRFDPGCLTRTYEVANTASLKIPFGTFVQVSVSGTSELITEIADASVTMLGVALIAQQGISDYANRQYSENEVAEVGVRGFFYVRVDQDNIPAVGGEIKILSATDADTGALTSTNTNAREITGNLGARIVGIEKFGGITVAEVYLDGRPDYVLSLAA